jgi:ribosome recycling factor
MKTVISGAEDRMKKTIAALEQEFNTLRSGRASTALFDKIKVDYYGQETPLNQVASISVPEARLVVIQPWDKSLLSPIEKALMKSELSLNPNNDGKLIRINIPPLTEQRRKELVKMAKNIAENSRVSIRNIRRDAIEELKKLEKQKEITEDDLKLGQDEVQKVTDSFIADINTMLDAKEQEIMAV